MRRTNAAKSTMALIAAGLLAACGQTSDTQMTSDDASGVDEAGWQEYLFDDLQLAKHFPAEPTRSEGVYWTWPLPPPDRDPEVAGESPSIILSASADNIDYEVTVVPLPDRAHMGASIMGECAFLSEESGTEQKNTYVRIDNGNRTVYGHQVVVDRSDDVGRMHNGCFFENGTFYRFSATVHPAHGNPDAPEAQEFATSGRFIDGA